MDCRRERRALRHRESRDRTESTSRSACRRADIRSGPYSRGEDRSVSHERGGLLSQSEIPAARKISGYVCKPSLPGTRAERFAQKLVTCRVGDGEAHRIALNPHDDPFARHEHSASDLAHRCRTEPRQGVARSEGMRSRKNGSAVREANTHAHPDAPDRLHQNRSPISPHEDSAGHSIIAACVPEERCSRPAPAPATAGCRGRGPRRSRPLRRCASTFCGAVASD